MAPVGTSEFTNEQRLLFITELHELLVQHFNEEELRTLCFSLDVAYDSLSGEEKTGKARELVLYLDRRARIPELVENGKKKRPDILWPNIPQSISPEQLHELVANSAYVLARLGRYMAAIERLETSLTYTLSRVLATDQKWLAMKQAVDHRIFEAALRKWYALETEDRDKIAEVSEALEVAINRIYAQMSKSLVRDSLLFHDIIHALTDAPVVYLTTTQKGSLAFIILPDGASLANTQRDHLDDYFIPPYPGPNSETRPQVGVGVMWLDNFASNELKSLLVEENATHHIAGGYLRARNLGTATTKHVLDTMLKTLGKQLIERLACFLRELDFERVTFILCGQLSVLPLHAAYYEGKTGPCYLLDEFEVTYAPSAWTLLRAEMVQSKPIESALVSSGGGDKAFTQEEARVVADIAGKAAFSPSQVFYESNVTPQWLLDHASVSQYWHLAYDVMIDAHWLLKSVVVLAEGAALKLTNLLQASHLAKPRLVTLSTVQPAPLDFDQFPTAGEPLPAIFLEAGAASIVSNLWRVNDLSTFFLMKLFYTFHFERDMAPAAALREAQRWLREEVTAGQAAEVSWQRYKVLYSQETPALTQVSDDLLHYGRLPSDNRPFAHPVYWAAFKISGV